MTSALPPPVQIGSAVSGSALDAGDPGERRVALQWAQLPGAWRHVDRALVRTTEMALFVVGVLFAIMITLEVISRFVFSFSISFVNASARMLLVWFFLLGAGIALRRGAHVGFELLVSALGARTQRVVVLVGLVMTMLFSLEMIWSGIWSIAPALRQTEAGLEVSIVWVVSALPAGFALLLYHALVLIYIELRVGRAPGDTHAAHDAP
jgi:TRAP-type C4-dicarboxylate transport system permease small subunit